MTQVIRISLSLLIAAVTLAITAPSSDAQLFRRLRDNIRSNNAPAQRATVPQRRSNSPYQVAPQPQGRYGQSLTPYARLTPDQRRQQTDPNLQSTSKPNPEQKTGQDRRDDADTVDVRIVTYYDPRTGRTFQRRFVQPANPAGQTQQSDPKSEARSLLAGQQKLRGGRDDGPSEINPTDDQNSAANAVPRFTIRPKEIAQTPSNVDQTLPSQSDSLALVGPPIVAADQTFNASPENQFGNANDQIRFDTAVAPASTAAIEIAPPELANAIPSSDQGAIYSVLEQSDRSDTDPQIDIQNSTDTVDDVESFFGSSQ